MLKTKLSILFIVPIALAHISHAQENASLASVIDKYARAEAEHDLFSGAVLVAKSGETVYQGAFGYAQKEKEILNEIGTQFSIGSIGKTLTAVLIMQLVEQDKLKLTDTLDKYLPDFPYEEKREIQIHHLLNHTSGLGNYFTHEDYQSKMQVIRSIDQALELVYDQKPLFEPGTQYAYSNSGMLVLGAIIEEVTGMSYREYLRKHILDPAGMSHSGIWYPEDDVPDRATGYSKTGEGTYEIETENEFPAFSDGGLYSTVGDMLKYDLALRDNQLLSPQYKEIMFTVTQPAENYAYGWEVGTFKDHDFTGHVGGCPGFSADFIRFQEDQVMIIVLSNYTDGAGMLAAKLRHLVFGADEDNIPLATEYDYNFNKGRYLSEVKKDYRASVEYFDKNIRGPEPHLPSLFSAARSRILGDFEVEEAIELLKEYMELNPGASRGTQAAVWWLSGEGYRKLNDRDRAIDCFKRSLEIKPDLGRAKGSLEQINVEK